MAIITSGTTFATGDQVTASTLNTQWSGAAFASGAVDSSTTQLSSGAIIVKDGGITSAKLAASVQATTQLSSLGTIVATPSDATALVGANTQTPRFQVNGTDTANFGAFLFNTTDSTFPAVYLTKSGNATIGSHTTVASGESLGGIIGCGSDGTNYQVAGQVKFECDGTVAAGYVPGRLLLRTATAAGTITTALTIDKAQLATFVGTVIAPAATTVLAPFRIPHGTAPTSPTNGDIWTTTAGLYVRINGATVGPLT